MRIPQLPRRELEQATPEYDVVAAMVLVCPTERDKLAKRHERRSLSPKRSRRCSPPPRRAAGVTTFSHILLQRPVVERQLRSEVLELPVLLFQVPQPPRLAHLHAAVLRLPAVIRPFGDAVPPADPLHLAAGLDLLSAPR